MNGWPDRFHSPSIIAPMLVMQIPDSRRKAAFTFARRNVPRDPSHEVESLLISFPGTPPEMLYIVKHYSVFVINCRRLFD